MEAPATSAAAKRAWLVLNGLTLAVGNCGGPLVMRLYYHGGGGSVWFTAFLETGGWPFLLIPLAFAYARRRRESPAAGLFVMKRRVLGASAAIGLLTGVVDYLYAFGVKKLPLSTSAVLVASQLAFTAAFAYLLVRHRFTAYTVNAIVTILVGAVVLATHAGGDRPKGETDREYFLGFFMTLMGAVLYGLVLPSIERTYQKARQAVTYTLVMEVQLVMGFCATAFCTVGILISKDYKIWRINVHLSCLGKRCNVAVFLCWSHRSHILRIIPLVIHHHPCLVANDRAPRCSHLQGEVPIREGCCIILVSLGIHFIFLWTIQRGEEEQDQEQEESRPRKQSK